MCVSSTMRPCPTGAVIVPAARFLADAAELAERGDPVGVIWPNDRNIAELAPWLTGWRWSRWCSRASRTAAPTARRGLLRERYGFRGELRATGEVLRDQFLFLMRAGFDTFEVVKHGRCARLRGGRPPLQRVLQPTGDGRVTWPAYAVAGRRKPRSGNMSA